MGCGTSDNNAEQAQSPEGNSYERKEMIGVGNHGRVYRSIFQFDKKQYALKVIDRLKEKESSTGKEQIERMKKVNQKNIAMYLNVKLAPNQIEIAMDIAKEGTLKKYIQKNGKLNELTISEVTEQILQGLKYLHDAGILHRDLKSNNVLIFPKMQIKISDFNLAQIYDKRLNISTKNNNVNAKNLEQIDGYRADSMVYMAPQVIKNLGVSEQSDIWSLGCIVLEMLTGKVPWASISTNTEETLKFISSGVHPPFPPNITKNLEDFLECCLSIVPSQRSTAEELLMHPFILINLKKTEMYKQNSDLAQSKIEKKEKGSKLQKSKKGKSKQQFYDDLLKSPPSIEKKIIKKNENSTEQRKYINRHSANGNQHDDKFSKLKSAVNSLSQKTQIKNVDGIRREDIITSVEDDDDDMVYLNNQKIKLRQLKLNNENALKQKNNLNKREYTEPTKIEKSSFMQLSSIESPNFSKNPSERYYKGSVPNAFEDSLDQEIAGFKFKTQPSLIENEDIIPKDKQYFKRPLKLLKKKLRESKRIEEMMKNVSIESYKDSVKEELEKIEDQNDGEEEVEYDQRLRSNTEISREEIAIDTAVARAERDRYLNEQKIFKKLRDKEKMQWETELKKGAEILKKQFSNRYSHNITNMIGLQQ